MAGKRAFIVCPLCGRNYPDYRYFKGEFSFSRWGGNFIYIRDMIGGSVKAEGPMFSGEKRKPGKTRGRGFPVVERIPFEQALQDKRYRKYALQLKEKVKELARNILTEEEKKQIF